MGLVIRGGGGGDINHSDSEVGSYLGSGFLLIGQYSCNSSHHYFNIVSVNDNLLTNM